MTNLFESRSNEYSSTYVVFDCNNAAEHQRLTIQDQMITTAMGGVLPEQPDPSSDSLPSFIKSCKIVNARPQF